MANNIPSPYTGGGGGSVTSVTAADTSITIAGTATAPTVATGTLDVIAADHPPAANWSNNSHKITSLLNGSAAQDAAAFGQIPTSAASIGGLLAANNLTDVSSEATSFKNLAPLTTKGDLIIESGTPAPARLAIGTAGQVLTTSTGGLPAWATAPVDWTNAVTVNGADPTGATDSTTAINAALSSVNSAGGGAVYLPAGLYLISQSLVMGSNTTLMGDGMGATTIRVKASTLASFTQVGTNTGCPMITTISNAAKNHLIVANLTLDGNQANAGLSLPGFADAPECAPVSIWFSSQVLIDAVEIINPIGYAVYLQQSSDCIVTRCRILTGAGSALGTNQQDGIHLTSCLRVTITGNVVDTGTGTAGDDGIAVLAIDAAHPCDNITVSGNVIRSAQSNIHLALNSVNNVAIANVTMTGNVFWGSSSSSAATILADTTPGGLTGISLSAVTIAGNNFQTIAGNGVQVSVPFTGLAITNNAFDTFQNSGNNGAYITNGKDFVFSGNVMTTCTGLSHGLQVGDSGGAGISNFAVSNNLIDMSGASSAGAGIIVRDSLLGSVSNNTIIGTGSGLYGIDISGVNVATAGVAVNSNRISAWSTGVTENNDGTQPDFNTILGNNLHGCTTDVNPTGLHTVSQPVALDVGGVAGIEQIQVLSGTRTFTSNTTAQAIFNASTNGTLTVQAATTYEFECVLSITGLSGSAHSASFGLALGGGATVTSILYLALSATANLAATGTAIVTSASATQIIPTGTTATALGSYIRGTIRINAGGTITPQLTQNTASAAAVVGANSFFRCWPAGTNTVTTVGNWS